MINPFSPTVANRCSDRFVQKLGVRRRRRGLGGEKEEEDDKEGHEKGEGDV